MSTEAIDKESIFGHKPGLFVLFFTEMWERFSYYGMRALFVLFLTKSLMEGGWAWSREDALELYGIYTGLVYFTPIIGGVIADKLLGYRWAVVIGALIMTLGHAFMAVETESFFYAGITALIIGNGLFKPNISSMVGQLYDNDEEKKDAAYTIFYMGINAGAFLGIMLCGYVGESVGWSYGFGLAGIFMFLGMLQFWFAKPIFGGIGDKKVETIEEKEVAAAASGNDMTRIVTWIGFATLMFLGFYFLLLPKEEWMSGVILSVVVAMVGYIMSDRSLSKIERDRLWVIVIFSFFVIFFWWAFEQAGGSMTIFAADYTNRVLEGSGAMIFKVSNFFLTIVPLTIITWVLSKLFKITFKEISLSNLILMFSFVVIWGIVIWIQYVEFSTDQTEVKASWFGILNSFFIIAFAPLFSKFWDKKIITSGAVKFAIGLILLGIGFAVLAFGSAGIPQGAKTASVSMVWLILAYYFHTMGELCISPVGLSYVSKLAPLRLVGVMFGIWFVSNFIANYAAGKTGSYLDVIVEEYSMTIFFLMFTVIPIVAGLIMFMLNPMMKRMMHGVDDE